MVQHVDYRWDMLPGACDPKARLNMQWQRQFIELSLDGITIETLPVQRELLVFEGESEVIRRIQELVEGAKVL